MKNSPRPKEQVAQVQVDLGDEAQGEQLPGALILVKSVEVVQRDH